MTTQITPVSDLDPRDFFDFATLKATCEMREADVPYNIVGMEVTKTPGPHGANWYAFKDNGSSILAVAHLDTCVPHDRRKTVLADTAGGQVVYSGALDDRLGAYVLSSLLPEMGLEFDLLFTVGEEMGMSTAEHFDPRQHHSRDYDWIIEFDRGGTDVVLYQYEDDDLIERVEATGARVEQGIFSDISYMEHLGVKALNWGVGYRDYHSTRGHVWLDDLFEMIEYFLLFHEENAGQCLPHYKAEPKWWERGGTGSYSGSRYEEVVPDVVVGSLTDCGEYSEADDDCSGDLLDTIYGPLCEAHWEWYR